jgi:tape measure domain-containing protein
VKRFTDYITEETKEIVVAWGRYNPPTIGHEKLMDIVKKTARGGQYRIYASQTQNSKDDPLDYKTKIKYARKMFPKHARNIMLDPSIRTHFQLMTKLYDEGFNKVTLVAGSDRIAEYDASLNKYNGVKGRHGFYNFEGGVTIVSSGNRDPDAKGVEGMSASKMRAAATANDFSSFSQGLPKGFRDGQALFNDVRKGLGLKESYDYREHIQLEPVSETREAYVTGELFAEGDVIVVKESDEVGQVIMLGSNYVLVEMADGKKLRKWLDDVELIERQDPDIKHRKGSQPANYHKGLAKSTKIKRDAQFKKQAKMDDDDPNAYKPAPGDKSAETKPSKHTKKFKQMYGEEVLSFNSFNDIITEDVDAALQKKADKTGIPKGILRQVYNRGVAAWKTGHRPGTTASQWGYARVNSFATKSKGTWGGADKDLAAKVRGK